MNQASHLRGPYYPQLDALRGVAALMVVINHFVLVGPLWWIPKSPLRVLALGHEAVILFFILSGYVLTLQLTSHRGIGYRDFLIKRLCRIYIPYLVVLLAAFSVINMLVIEKVSWAGAWFNDIWTGQFSGSDMRDHILFIGQYRANRVMPVIWSLIYEMRISLIMPVVAYWVARARVRTCLAAALLISMASFALVLAEGLNASSANFIGDWAMTGHYLSIFIVGATLAIHRAHWQRWLATRDRTRAVLAGSLALYFLSRSVMSVESGAIGQYIFDWCVAAGGADIVCTAMVSKPFALALSARPIVFLGTISYSLYLTHTVVLLAVVHLMPSPDSAWPAIATAAVLVIPVAIVTHFVVERPSIWLGKFLTGRSTTATSRAKQVS